MALQCPNCGGYKTYRWKAYIRKEFMWIAGFFIAGVLMPVIWFIPLLLLARTAYEMVFKRPKGRDPWLCEICEFSWDAHNAKAVDPQLSKAALRMMGEELLKREAEAARQREEDARARRF